MGSMMSSGSEKESDERSSSGVRRKISVEVAYAEPRKQRIVLLSVEEGSTAYDAAKLSGLEKEFPNLNIDEVALGVFGKAERKPKERVLRAGERVEIYRPLIADPKEVRKRRAAKAAEQKANKKQEQSGN